MTRCAAGNAFSASAEGLQEFLARAAPSSSPPESRAMQGKKLMDWRDTEKPAFWVFNAAAAGFSFFGDVWINVSSGGACSSFDAFYRELRG